ncbi:MAG: sulfurtransferase TusA family protein [Euryarchaeota archaeon]|nr:sulfurtransferase TusA family protein [Euryarchaeota archaeon]
MSKAIGTPPNPDDAPDLNATPEGGGVGQPIVLDAVGFMCPVPIFMLAQKIREMETGQVLELWADDPAAKEDVPAWCRRTGNLCLGMKEEDPLKFYVKVR